jgi:hypothetical protein
LSRKFRRRWFQRRRSAVPGNTAASTSQISRCPSPITSFGACNPRSLRSRKIAAQLSVDSRYPVSTARMTFWPSRNAARTTSIAALSFSRPPGFVDTPWLGRKGASTMLKSHRPYPAEFRQRIIELVRKGRTPEELGRQFEPSPRRFGTGFGRPTVMLGGATTGGRPWSRKKCVAYGARIARSGRSGSF